MKARPSVDSESLSHPPSHQAVVDSASRPGAARTRVEMILSHWEDSIRVPSPLAHQPQAELRPGPGPPGRVLFDGDSERPLA